MTVSGYAHVLNGMFDLTVAPRDSQKVFDTSNDFPIGCTKEGFSISATPEINEVTTNCNGVTPVEKIFEGFSSYRMSLILQEHNKPEHRAGLAQLLSVTSDNRGKLEGIGTQLLRQAKTWIVKATPRAGTSSALIYTDIYFYAVSLANGEEWNQNFNIKDQQIPIVLDMMPVIVEDDISTGHKIWLPADDFTSFVAADATMYYWRETFV